VAARAKENISRARRSAVILAFTAGAAALLGAAAAWFAACAGGRVRALCQRAIPSTAAFDPVTLTKGEYALLLAFLQAPAGSVRRRVLQSSCQPPNRHSGDMARSPWAESCDGSGVVALCRAVSSGVHMLADGDRTGWLGRQDSNLCIRNQFRKSNRKSLMPRFIEIGGIPSTIQTAVNRDAGVRVLPPQPGSPVSVGHVRSAEMRFPAARPPIKTPRHRMRISISPRRGKINGPRPILFFSFASRSPRAPQRS
jgi:hypothetical protein